MMNERDSMDLDKDDHGRVATAKARRRWPWYAAIAVLLVVVLAAGSVARLLSGPVWTELLAGMAADRIAAQIGPGATVDVGIVGVALDGELQPEIHLRDVVVSLPNLAVVSLDTVSFAADWSGDQRGVDRLIADHVLVDLPAATTENPAVSLLAAAETLLDPVKRYVEVGALTLVRRDRWGGRATALDRAAVTLETAFDGRLELALAGSGSGGNWSIRMDGAPVSEGDGRVFDVRTSGLDIADLAVLAGETMPPASGPLSFQGSVTVAEGAVTAGKGQVTLGPLASRDGAASPLVGAGSRIEVALRPGGRTLVLIPSPVVLPGGQAIVGGEIAVPGPGETAWRFDLDIALRSTGLTDDRRGKAAITGSYDPPAGLFVVDDLQAHGEGATFAAAMRLTHDDEQVTGALSGVFPLMSVEALKTIWPGAVVPDARRWVMENVDSGSIHSATLDLSVVDRRISGASEGEANAALWFRYENVVFRAFDDGPMVRDARGTGFLRDGRLQIALESGRVDLGREGSLQVEAGLFVVADILAEPPTGEIAFDLAGDASSTLALWKRLPQSATVNLPVEPVDATGRMTAEIALSLPLIRDVPAEAVVYDARLHLAELGFGQPVDGRKFSDGSIEIRVADGMAVITGDALLDGVRAEVDITEPLTRDGASSSAVRLRLTEKDRARLGIDLGDMVSGPVSVSLTSSRRADGAEVQVVEADLEEARIRLMPLGFTKAKGKPGTVRFVMRKVGARTAIDDLVIEAGGSRIGGELVFDADRRLVSARLPRITIRPGDRLSITAQRGEGGVLEIVAEGDRFDARGLVRDLLRGNSTGVAGESIRIDAAIGTVTGFADENLTGFNLAAAINSGRVSALAVTAQTAGSGAMSATLTPTGDNRRLELEAGEVGRLLRFLGIYRRVYGGRAVITGIVGPSGALRAAVDGSRWRIVDEPALARLSTAAEKGPNAGLATVDIERLLFDLAFANGVLTIEDGVVRATTAGLSIQGDVDFSRDTLRLSGTYLPVSAFDSLLGKIPLIGATVFAGGRAGLLGVTFRLSGSLDDPSLSVNPLSAIAPGIFRKLFELR